MSNTFKKLRKERLKKLLHIKNNNEKVYFYILKEENKKHGLREETLGEDRAKSKKIKYDIDVFKNLSFKHIINKNFKEDNIKILRNINFKYNSFYQCDFSKIKFINCNFSGSKFINCRFEEIVFEGCVFSERKIIRGDKRGGTISSCIFKDRCTLEECVFESSYMDSVIIEKSKLYYINFNNTSLKGAIISESIVNSLEVADCDFRAFSLIKSSLEEINFQDRGVSKFDFESFIDTLRVPYMDKIALENNFKAYRTIAGKLEENNLYSLYGEYYYLSKKSERKLLRGGAKLKSTLNLLICGYGERPSYALVSSLFITVIFAIMYMFTGLSVASYGILKYAFLPMDIEPLMEIMKDFSRALHFSIVTFTTVGYGNITPIDGSVFLCSIEMLLGVTMVGIWTATLAKKISR